MKSNEQREREMSYIWNIDVADNIGWRHAVWLDRKRRFISHLKKRGD